MNDVKLIDKEGKSIIKYLLHLCAEGEEKFVKEYIDKQTEASGDFFKPIYYLLLKRLAHVDYKRMPNEFLKTVLDLDQAINELIIAYK